jgi:hypothetical protein
MYTVASTCKGWRERLWKETHAHTQNVKHRLDFSFVFSASLPEETCTQALLLYKEFSSFGPTF